MGKKRIIIVFIIVLLFLVAIILSTIYYNNKYSVHFETGTNDVFLTKYVSKNGKVSEPIEPYKKGYIFVEWQLDGKKYDFDKEVKSNLILTAKWVKEEYITISFITDSNIIIDDIKLLKGESIKELPESKKEGYNFIGWYLNNQKYNNEELYDDTILYAKYENKEKEFNIGDIVIITGNYSSSAYNINANYYKAIGWERYILNIISECEYPYVVGNSEGVTGYFKSDSIKIKGEL